MPIDSIRSPKGKGKSQPKSSVTLEIEDEDARQTRLQRLLESIEANTTSSKPLSGPEIPMPLPPSRPCAIPPSDILSRAEAFLPLLASSNAELATLDPASLDIEHLEDETEMHIEMNLGLGVFEVRRKGEGTSESSSSESESDSDSDSDPSSSSSDSASEDNDSEDEAAMSTSSDPKPASTDDGDDIPGSRKPLIEVLE